MTLLRIDKLTIALLLLIAINALFATRTEGWFEFDREKILAGEVWRLITSQFIHYGNYHALMNAVALIIINTAFWRESSVKAWLTTLLICLLSIGCGLLIFDSQLFYYAGFSGVLHGLLVTGLLMTWAQTPIINSLALLVVAGKVVYEQSAWFDPHHALLPVPVAADAHLWGALAGLITGAALLFLQRRPVSDSDT